MPSNGSIAVSAQLDSLDHRVAVDGGRTVGTFLSFDQELTAVGGTTVPVRAVLGGHGAAHAPSPVGSSAGHMRECLAAARAGGSGRSDTDRRRARDLRAVRLRSEHGRQSTTGSPWTAPAYRCRPSTKVRYVDGDEYLAASIRIREVLDFPGRVSKLDINLRRTAGLVHAGGPDDTLRVVLRRDGEAAGVLAYTMAPKWSEGRPDSR